MLVYALEGYSFKHNLPKKDVIRNQNITTYVLCYLTPLRDLSMTE